MSLKSPIIILAAYWIALLLGTHLPAEHFPQQFDPVDKMLHLTAYGGLAVLVMFVITRIWPHRDLGIRNLGIRNLGIRNLGIRNLGIRNSGIWVFVGLAVHGALDEFTQGFVPGRSPDVIDWVADVIGVGIGMAVFFLAMAVWNRRSMITERGRLP